MRFEHGHRKVFDGEADVVEWDADRKHLRVIPEGWKHGITIGADEIVEINHRSPAP